MIVDMILLLIAAFLICGAAVGIAYLIPLAQRRRIKNRKDDRDRQIAALERELGQKG